MTTPTKPLDVYEVWMLGRSTVMPSVFILLTDLLRLGDINPGYRSWALQAFGVLTAHFNQSWLTKLVPRGEVKCLLCGSPNAQEKGPEAMRNTDEERFVRSALWTLGTLSMGARIVEMETTRRVPVKPFTPVAHAISAIEAHAGRTPKTVEGTLTALAGEHVFVVDSRQYERGMPPLDTPSECPRCYADWHDSLRFPYYHWPVPAGVQAEKPDILQQLDEADVRPRAHVVRPVKAGWGSIPALTEVVIVRSHDDTFAVIEWKGREQKVHHNNLLYSRDYSA